MPGLQGSLRTCRCTHTTPAAGQLIHNSLAVNNLDPAVSTNFLTQPAAITQFVYYPYTHHIFLDTAAAKQRLCPGRRRHSLCNRYLYLLWSRSTASYEHAPGMCVHRSHFRMGRLDEPIWPPAKVQGIHNAVGLAIWLQAHRKHDQVNGAVHYLTCHGILVGDHSLTVYLLYRCHSAPDELNTLLLLPDIIFLIVLSTRPDIYIMNAHVIFRTPVHNKSGILYGSHTAHS